MNVPRTLEEWKAEQKRLIREIHSVVAKNPHLQPLLADVPPLPEDDEQADQQSVQDASAPTVQQKPAKQARSKRRAPRIQAAVTRQNFTTPVKNVSPSGAGSSPAPRATCSPPHREFGPGGEKIEHLASKAALAAGLAVTPQRLTGSPVAVCGELIPASTFSGDEAVDFHHEGESGGEKILQHGDLLIVPGETPPDSLIVPRQQVPRGRPREIDEEMQCRIVSLMSVGLSLRQTAAKLGVHHTSIMAAMRRDKPFADQVVAARSEAVAQPLAVVIKASRSNWRAAAWLAKYLQDRFYKAEQPLEERTLEERGK